MPELPEVETVRRGLVEILNPFDLKIKKIECSTFPLRVNPDVKLLAKMKRRPLKAIHRKAKYLLFELDNYFLLSHLGMTGSWRIETDQRKHDHIRVFLSDGQILTYNDPRRFGMFDVLEKQNVEKDKRFTHLGPDPVLDKKFNGPYLYSITRKRKAPIKTVIMSQERVVGVGNIYASEALYLAGIHPLRPSESLSKKECSLLATAIVDVLLEAIKQGGTTISDFRQAGGSEGYFQNLLLAYGRDKEECYVCGSAIQSQFIVGRNSFWCPSCQTL